MRIYIVGGSSGIGLALAEYYAESGNDLVLLARDAQKLNHAVESCRKRRHDPTQVVEAELLDITRYESLSSELSSIVERPGLPELLIVSAGISTNGTFLNTTRNQFEQLLDVNFSGAREVTRAILPAMIDRGSGQVAFISSMAGLLGAFGYSAYSASKFALNGFVEVLRQELRDSGISISLVCPSEVATPMIEAEADSILRETRVLKDLVGTMPASVAAKKIARALRQKRALVIPGIKACTVAWIGRHFPGLFAKSAVIWLRLKA